MDILSLTGLMLGLLAVMVGAVLKGAGLHALVSSAAFMIVVVGTIAADLRADAARRHAPRVAHLSLGDEAAAAQRRQCSS